MSFDGTADAYTRFMGRYSERLAAPFADFAGVRPGQRALDVGCGAGALTAELVTRLGPEAVCAAEPSSSYVTAVRERLPGVDVRRASAEALPFSSGGFDAVLAQLVVHFMADPVAGLREMARVTRTGGTVGACVWDHGGGRSPVTAFWRAARRLDPEAARAWPDRPGGGEGELAALFASAGLGQGSATALRVPVRHDSFDQWWEPFALGVGPVGGYLTALGPQRSGDLRDACREMLGDGPFEVSVAAWAVTGVKR